MTDNAIKIGLWGCGGRTQSLVNDAVDRGLAAVTCCYDVNAVTTKKLAADHDAAVVGSAGELLERGDVDAFLICLFPGFHADALLKALPVGKPVYIEKPIATTWDQFEDVTQAARIHDTRTHVGLGHRYFAVFSMLTELVRDGKIGDLVSLSVNWLTALKPVEAFSGGRDDWHLREDTGGELIQHFCHVFDWLRALGGEFSEITAMSNHTVHTDIPIEDTWDINLRYASGALVNFHSSMNNPRGTELGWIEGSKGSLEWEWSNPSSIRFFENAYPKKEAAETIPVPALPYPAMTRGFLRFLESITTGRPCDIDIWDGLWASYIPLMARRGAEEGRKLSLKRPSDW